MKLKEAEFIILQSGNKLTAKRQKMLEIFAESGKYLSAKDVLNLMSVSHPSLSYDTVYRNLAMLSDLNILEATEISGEKRFRFQCNQGVHHHHFICTECGMTKEISACPMDSLNEDLSEFSITGHKFEIYGQCNKC